MSTAGRHYADGTLDLSNDPELAAAGTLVSAINAFGVALTSAITDVGYGTISSNADLVVLATIVLDGPQRPKRLADLTGLTTGGTTNQLDRLEAADLVGRTTDGLEDGRAVLVEVTPAGRRAIVTIGDVVATQVAASPGHFDEMRERFGVLGRDIAMLPSSLTDSTSQLRDILRLAEAGRVIGAVFDEVLQDPTPSKSVLTLWFASQPGGVQPGRITQLTGLSSAGVSELLERLERRELIERTAGRPPDRRVVVVEATSIGRTLLATALGSLVEHLDDVQELLARS